MLQPSDLSNDTLAAIVRARYGLPVTGVEFLPLGHDASAWVYRLQAGGERYFLKLRRGINVPGLVVPRALRDRGVPRAIAPLATLSGELWVDVDGLALILYPFVDGRSGLQVGLTDGQWVELGEAMRHIHTAPVGPELASLLRRESYVPGWIDAARRVGELVAAQAFDDPQQEEMAVVWRARRAEIDSVLDRAVALGGRLRRAGLPLVVCHADLHVANVLIDTAGQMWIADWDETLLAPKERDLMFVVGGIYAGRIGPREEALFFRGYGPADVDPLALAYYRCAWAAQDIGAFGEQMYLTPGASGETRADALYWFDRQFAPGAIVDLARQAGRALAD